MEGLDVALQLIKMWSQLIFIQLQQLIDINKHKNSFDADIVLNHHVAESRLQ